MRRIDLRKSTNLFVDLKTHIDNAKLNEVIVCLFEIGDFTNVEASFEFIYSNKCEMLNSLKFNQMDWMITFKKVEL